MKRQIVMGQIAGLRQESSRISEALDRLKASGNVVGVSKSEWDAMARYSHLGSDYATTSAVNGVFNRAISSQLGGTYLDRGHHVRRLMACCKITNPVSSQEPLSEPRAQ